MGRRGDAERGREAVTLRLRAFLWDRGGGNPTKLPKALAKPAFVLLIAAMSVTELKREVDGLTPDERLELTDYLRWRTQKDDPQWQAELGRRLDRCLAGQGRPAEELQALHERLSSESR